LPPYRLELETEDFLARYWQREHAYLPAALAPFVPPADADELAGLALEEGVDARIVTGQAPYWEQHRGPFRGEDFQRQEPWTLLVQSVDHYWDEAAELLHAIPSLPTWRLDDVMMSYANDGGSAGPHYDNYDVFIIQGEGQRRWQIGGFCDSDTPRLPHDELRLLANFQARAEYLLNPGDVLYIPPGVAHFGVSLGESTSFSIGFRAPRLSDLLAAWVDNRLEEIEDDVLFRDPGREPVWRRGEITSRDLERASVQVRAALENDDPRWLGEALTIGGASAPQRNEPADLSLDSVANMRRTPGSRLAWYHAENELLVFANGACRDVPMALQEAVEQLCDDQRIPVDATLDTHDAAGPLLRWLMREGCIEPDD